MCRVHLLKDAFDQNSLGRIRTQIAARQSSCLSTGDLQAHAQFDDVLEHDRRTQNSVVERQTRQRRPDVAGGVPVAKIRSLSYIWAVGSVHRVFDQRVRETADEIPVLQPDNLG